MFQLRDKELARAVVERLKARDDRLTVMHVCGTHQDTIVRHGLDGMLEECGVRIVQGPGCPVCVTTPREIEMAIALAEAGVTVATFGDMLRVPGDDGSLQKVKAEGGDVRVVYDINEAINIAEQGTEVVFIAVGFETTAPTTASALRSDPPDTFSVLSCHRLIPPAIEAILAAGEVALDGIIAPGHVSVIIGASPYEPLSRRHHIPQVVAGFEPVDVLMGIWMLARQVDEGRNEVENEYRRVVSPEGNQRAQRAIDEVFEPVDAPWRGFPVIPASKLALRPRFAPHDASRRYADLLAPLREHEFEEPPGCICGDVLRGVCPPEACNLFGTRCTPRHPVGPCMVSREGSCNIAFRYSHD